MNARETIISKQNGTPDSASLGNSAPIATADCARVGIGAFVQSSYRRRFASEYPRSPAVCNSTTATSARRRARRAGFGRRGREGSTSIWRALTSASTSNIPPSIDPANMSGPATIHAPVSRGAEHRDSTMATRTHAVSFFSNCRASPGQLPVMVIVGTAAGSSGRSLP